MTTLDRTCPGGSVIFEDLNSAAQKDRHGKTEVLVVDHVDRIIRRGIPGRVHRQATRIEFDVAGAVGDASLRTDWSRYTAVPVAHSRGEVRYSPLCLVRRTTLVVDLELISRRTGCAIIEVYSGISILRPCTYARQRKLAGNGTGVGAHAVRLD